MFGGVNQLFGLSELRRRRARLPGEGKRLSGQALGLTRSSS
jgi:hypothetical protein